MDTYTKKIQLTVDGHLIEATEGQTLLQAALEAGIYIPHLCYHPNLTPQGGCKLCTVEIEGMSGLVQSCETPVSEGMVVSTKNDKVKQLRMVSLELILASHPKDCTSCDKYLNCELQALMQQMGVVHSRMREIDKECTRIQVSDSLIQKEMFRCVQCGRCVRACHELRGVGALGYNKRNGESYVGTQGDRPLADTDCRFCGACVEVCPTGAIQDMKDVFPKDVPRQAALIPCKDKCPAHTDIPTYVRLVKEGKYSDAVSVFREKLTFPLSLGHVCTHACESACKRSHLNDAVSIRNLKRFAVENDETQSWKERTFHCSPTGKKVSVIGGGPAGMTAAYFLSKKGHDVTVFERQPLAGGMLSYGIPKYRLSQQIVDAEVETLLEAGIKLSIGKTIQSVEEIRETACDAALVAVGTHKGKRPLCYSKQWSNAYDAVDFCRMANEKSLPELGDTLTVYGGGNVAFDCARNAKKAGISIVRVVCLEPRDNMLADEEEVTAALQEGIQVLNSSSMLGVLEQDGQVQGIELVHVLRFSFGESGLELETEAGSEATYKTDSLVFATGQQTDLTETFGLDLIRGSFIETIDGCQTKTSGIFAAGDAVYGTKSVVEAIASGRRAAEEIDKYLGGDGDMEEHLYDRTLLSPSIGIIANFAKLERIDQLCGACDAENEATRCLQCDLRLEIEKVKYWVDPHYKSVREVTK